MKEQREITDIQLSSGTWMPASKAICETCNTLDLGTDFEQVDPGRWRLTCPKGHSWWVEL